MVGASVYVYAIPAIEGHYTYTHRDRDIIIIMIYNQKPVKQEIFIKDVGVTVCMSAQNDKHKVQ